MTKFEGYCIGGPHNKKWYVAKSPVINVAIPEKLSLLKLPQPNEPIEMSIQHGTYQFKFGIWEWKAPK